MSQIGKFKVNKDNLETTLKCIDRMLGLASYCGGKFFGGYVRDVIVPRMKNPNCDVSFKDVDIWFTSDEDAEEFVKLMKTTEKIFDRQIHTNQSIEYKFKRTQYYFLNEACPFNIDVIVSKTFPVNDFDVNFLTYYVKDAVRRLNAMGSYEEHFLIECINKKEIHMLDSYADELSRKDWGFHAHKRRFNERYIAKGWTIIYDGVKITNPISGSFKGLVAETKRESKELEKLEGTKNLENIKKSEKINKLEKTRKLNKFIEMDKLLQEAIINRNKAFYDCIVDFEIIDKSFVSNNLVDYPKHTVNSLELLL